MRTSILLNPDVELKLDAYRRIVRATTGKMPTRTTAANELLLNALNGVEPGDVPAFSDLVERVRNLEARKDGDS